MYKKKKKKDNLGSACTRYRVSCHLLTDDMDIRYLRSGWCMRVPNGVVLERVRGYAWWGIREIKGND